MLCLREGRNDPQGLERVLPVLDRRLYDGGDGGVVFRASLRAEASADLEFGLGRPERLLAVVVRGRDGRVGEEGEDVAPMFVNALLEFVQLGLLAVFPCVDGRPGEQFLQAFLHLRPHILPDVPLMPLLALVFTMGLAPCSSSAILTLSFSISSSLRTRLRFRTSTTLACSWSFSASSVESRSSASPSSRKSCSRLRVSLTRSASTLLLNPALKSFSIPRK